MRAYGTYLLVMSMALVSIMAVRHGTANYQAIVDRYGLSSADWSWLDIDGYGQLLSYSFLHGGAAHFLGNTLFLLLAGLVVERRTGFRWFGVLFVAGVLTSGLVHILGFPGESRALIGASGAVAALFGAAWVVAGDYGLRLRVPVARRWFALTLRRVLLAWLGLQLWGLVPAVIAGGETPVVAYWSHLAGFATGIAMAALFVFIGTLRRGAELQPDFAPGYASGGD